MMYKILKAIRGPDHETNDKRMIQYTKNPVSTPELPVIILISRIAGIGILNKLKS